MKKKNYLLLLLISISFLSCNSSVKNPTISISDIDADFPVTEQLEFKPFNKYSISGVGGCMIDGSTLWLFEEGESNYGSCYDLNTGEKLSTIVSRGRASNELTGLDAFEMVGDSILFFENQKTIKTFAKKDIIGNVPMGDRKCTVTTVPDSINAYRITKLPNGSVIAAIKPSLALISGDTKEEISDFNKKTVAVFNNKEAKSYETINYESFNITEAKGTELAANDLIKMAYANGTIGVKDNDLAALSVSNQFILYTFDIKNGNVVNEKRYTEMQRSGGGTQTSVSFNTKNNRDLNIVSIKTSDKYILCAVSGYFSEEDKNSKLSKNAIFIFDWELNPIKKFDFPEREDGYYSISNDCESVYFCGFSEEGLALHKADLGL